MLTFLEVLAAAKTLVEGDDTKKLDKLVALFADPRAPAELAVVRHYVAERLGPQIADQLGDLDTGRRLAALQIVRQTFPASLAANLLRRMVRDPAPTVTSRARSIIADLQLAPTRPPGARVATPDATAWAFGIFATTWAKTGARPLKPRNVNAIKQHGLPNLGTNADVAKLLGLAAGDLPALMRPGTGKGSAYIEFEIPKAKGGTRRIAAPRDALRTAQRKILDAILAKVPMHPACHGFVAGRSTVTNATPHVGSALVVKLDLRDFFPTVHYRRVVGLFEHLGYGNAVARTLAGLTTYRGKLANGTVLWPGVLPQGAPTSPALANLACRRLDRRLEMLAAKYAATYTRYADDLTFSFATPPEIAIGRFLWWVDGICTSEGFHERADKRRILRGKHQQRVTGIVVNEAVHVPRADRKRFRAILHNCKTTSVAAQAKGRDDFAAYLRGYAAYVHMVDAKLGAKLVAEVEELLRG